MLMMGQANIEIYLFSIQRNIMQVGLLIDMNHKCILMKICT